MIAERYTNFISYLLLAVSVALTLWGLINFEWITDYRYTSNGMIKYFIYFIVTSSLAFTGISNFKKSPLLVGTIISILLALYANALWSLVVVLWIAISSIILGKSLLSIFLGNIQHNILSNLLVGIGIFGTSVGLLAHFPYNYPGIYSLTLIIPLVIWRKPLKDFLISQLKWYEYEYTGSLSVKILDALIVGVALIHFILGLMPDIGFDSLAMHLFIPAQLFLRHQWGFAADTYAWAVMPMLGDWIYSIGYMLGGETSARLINVGFIFALGWLIRDLVSWAGGNSIGSRLAVLLFLSTPLTLVEGSTLFIESVLATFVVTGAFALLRSCSANGNPDDELPVAGFLLGCALSTKALTLFILPVLLLVLAIRYRMWLRKDYINFALIGLGLFLTFGIIPYLTALILTGNPVFPFYNGIFKSSFFGMYNFVDGRWQLGLSWKTLYLINFDSKKYFEAVSGVAGFQWLLLLPTTSLIILMKWQKNGMLLLLIGLASFLLIFNFAGYLRYIFPLFPFLCATIGIGISQSDTSLKLVQSTIACCCVGLNLIFINAGPNPYVDFPIEYLSSQSDREFLLRQLLPMRSAVGLVNAMNAEHRPVGFFADPLSAGLASDALYPSWYNSRFNAMIDAASTVNEVAHVLKNNKIDYLIVDDSWGNAGKRSLLDQLTDTVLKTGEISVRTFRRDSVQSELLKNAKLDSPDDWILDKGVKFTPDKELLVSVESSATQTVPVTPNERYLLSVKFRCSTKSAQGRMQVNWLDSTYKMIKADIHVNDCQANMTGYSMKVIAPPNAGFAVVYALAHTGVPVLFKEVSFKDD